MKNQYIKPQQDVIEISPIASILAASPITSAVSVDSKALLDSDDEVGAKAGGDDSWE